MRKRIIILEDDLDIRDMIEYLLVEENFEVVCYDRAAKFWKGMETEKADLILLDIMLPDGNGLNICEQLKASDKTAMIPIVIMSAHHNRLTKDCPAEDFITKPFNVGDFVSRIQKQVA